MKRPTLCPDCGAFIRLSWTEYCGSCGAGLGFEDVAVATVSSVEQQTNVAALEWLLRPRHVIAGAVGAVTLASLAVIAYALSTIQHLEPTDVRAQSGDPAPGVVQRAPTAR